MISKLVLMVRLVIGTLFDWKYICVDKHDLSKLWPLVVVGWILCLVKVIFMIMLNEN